MTDSAHCYTPSWCRCPDEPMCQLCKQGRCPVDSAHPDEATNSQVSAASDDMPPNRLRVGRKVGRTIYEQYGPEPSDDDPLVGVMDTWGLAAEVVKSVNRKRGFDD